MNRGRGWRGRVGFVCCFTVIILWIGLRPSLLSHHSYRRIIPSIAVIACLLVPTMMAMIMENVRIPRCALPCSGGYNNFDSPATFYIHVNPISAIVANLSPLSCVSSCFERKSKEKRKSKTPIPVKKKERKRSFWFTLQNFYRLAFLNSLMRPFVLASCPDTALSLSNSAPIFLARTLPNSTPHWSNELMFQMAPSVNVRCS